jgi:hypothetical protein
MMGSDADDFQSKESIGYQRAQLGNTITIVEICEQKRLYKRFVIIAYTQHSYVVNNLRLRIGV